MYIRLKAECPDKLRERGRLNTAAWRERNPERAREVDEKSRAANAEKLRARRREAAKNNKAAYAAWERARQAAKLKATPKWVDRREMLPFYQQAEALTRETGVIHEVDHIIPIKGEFVSGLHVPWNLQVLTKSENARKSNRVIFDESFQGLPPPDPEDIACR